MFRKVFLSSILIVLVKEVIPAGKDAPAEPRYPSAYGKSVQAKDVQAASRLFGVPSATYAWERTGLFQGDIPMKLSQLRNVALNEKYRWQNAIVPVYINSSDFSRGEIDIILGGMEEIENSTCVRFRKFRKNDTSYIVVRGNSTGCWSLVGRHEGGQILHLQPRDEKREHCLRHGTVVHEFLHALGLHHQQSSPERDDYVNIVWDNIKKGQERNFVKYNFSVSSTYNLPYDYSSVMHYSGTAFSKDSVFKKLQTIKPTFQHVHIGQRKRMSGIDAEKILRMYKCREMDMSKNEEGWEFYDYGMNDDL